MSLLDTRNLLITAIETEMGESNVLPTSLAYLRDEYGISPTQLGRLLHKIERGEWNVLPGFDLEYKPGWDFNLIVRRKK